MLATGQTPEVIKDGKGLLTHLREAATEQQLKKINKKNATLTRHEKIANLYETVTQITEVGRFVFAETPARYVLFTAPWGRNHAKNSIIFEGEILSANPVILLEKPKAETKKKSHH